jgi:DNA polymerase-3 subunit gamma/tau
MVLLWSTLDNLFMLPLGPLDSELDPLNTICSPHKQGAYHVLARKYRPHRFSQVVGQDILVRLITQALKRDRLGHGFLFSGMRGVGKTTTARLLACALNCTNLEKTEGEIEPCGVCDSCQAFAAEKHIDIIEMDAASHTGVDDIREILEACRYRPVLGKYKVFIIDEVHMLSKSAFNALLKTLEEPPEHVKFIFATTEIQKVLPTVVSRCLRFDLKRLDTSVLVPYLQEICTKENIAADPQALFLLAHAGGGSARDSLSLLDQAILLASQYAEEPHLIQAHDVRQMLGLLDRKAFHRLFEAVLKGEAKKSLETAQSLDQEGIDPLRVLEELSSCVHHISSLLVGVTEPLLGMSSEEKNFLEEKAKETSLPLLGRLWQMLLKGREEMERAPFPQRAFEMLLVRLAYVTSLPTPDQLLKGAVLKEQPSSVPPQRFSSSLSLSPTDSSLPPLLGASLNNFQDLIAATISQREGLLQAHLTQDVVLISFQQGRLEISLKPGSPVDFPRRLQAFLRDYTKRPWQVIVVPFSEKSGQTLSEQAAEKKRLLEEQIKDHPALDTARSFFPGVVIEEVKTLS